MIKWDEIKKDYLSGMKPREISEKYDINYKTLTGRITREGWKKTQNKIVEKLGEKIANLEAVAIQQMRENERKHSDVMIKAILTKLILNGEINPVLNSQDISNLVNAYEKIQRIKYKSFGIKDGFELDITTPTDTDFKIVKK